MTNKTVPQSKRDKVSKERAPYETPAIIYEGLISTRAGSTVPLSPSDADPASVFSDGG